MNVRHTLHYTAFIFNISFIYYELYIMYCISYLHVSTLMQEPIVKRHHLNGSCSFYMQLTNSAGFGFLVQNKWNNLCNRSAEYVFYFT